MWQFYILNVLTALHSKNLNISYLKWQKMKFVEKY